MAKKHKNERYARNYILIAKCMTEPRALELEKLMNGKGYNIGVSAENGNLYLHQLEAEEPYGKAMIAKIRKFAQSWSSLTNAISV